MAFTAVKNDNNSGLMKEGEYEVTLKLCFENVSHAGNVCITFDFIVREDVEQEYRRKHIFKSFWQKDDGSYDIEKIGKYAASLGIKPGEEFELADLEGRQCIVVIKHWTNQKTGETKECIFYTKPTEHPIEVHTTKPSEGVAETDDDDLPF